MKKSEFLDRFFYGEIRPEEQFPVTAGYRRALKNVIELERSLSRQLNREQKELLKRLTQEKDAVLKEEALIRFKQGFRLGMRLFRSVF